MIIIYSATSDSIYHYFLPIALLRLDGQSWWTLNRHVFGQMFRTNWFGSLVSIDFCTRGHFEFWNKVFSWYNPYVWFVQVYLTTQRRLLANIPVYSLGKVSCASLIQAVISRRWLYFFDSVRKLNSSCVSVQLRIKWQGLVISFYPLVNNLCR